MLLSLNSLLTCSYPWKSRASREEEREREGEKREREGEEKGNWKGMSTTWISYFQ